MLLRIPTCLVAFALSLVSAVLTYNTQQQAFLPPTSYSFTPLPILEEASLTDLLSGLRNGNFTSLRLTQAYLSRITAFNDLNAIITLNPYALTEASRADSLRSNLSSPSAELTEHYPLLGLPFLVKDNIAIPPSSGPTTAGSYALVDAVVHRASPVVQRLLDAGAVLLGTTNLDEFAQAKGDHPWAWSARGGQTKSIYAPEREEGGGRRYGPAGRVRRCLWIERRVGVGCCSWTGELQSRDADWGVYGLSGWKGGCRRIQAGERRDDAYAGGGAHFEAFRCGRAVD
jgi:hypothetical protein